MYIDQDILKQALESGGYMATGDIAAAESVSQEQGLPLQEYLIENNLLTADLVGQSVAELFGISFVDLESSPPSDLAIQQIPEAVAQKNRLIVVDSNTDSVVVATDVPDNPELESVVTSLFPGKNISIQYALPDAIHNALTRYRSALEEEIKKLITAGSGAIEILNLILETALTARATDVHFEPQVESVAIRFRVDGVLIYASRIDYSVYTLLLNRIKVQSGIRIDEHVAAQDGSMQIRWHDTPIDIRVSIVPTVEGEKIALRLLGSYIQGLNLSDLGLSEEYRDVVVGAANKPFGMILTVGATGSGKTTTLYALVKQLNAPGVNITTIEDPVEYKIGGINQIRVNTQTGLSFARGLRSVVRQDPDIILVGEIRDTETAEIAVNAALTGHLLLSTFHANDAATAIPRLLTMGIEPFMLASTLELVIGQRLVRKICEQCRYSLTVTRSSITRQYGAAVAKYFPKTSNTMYAGKGCVACGQTGYRGRTAVFECIQNTPELQDLILQSPSAQEVWKLAKAQGSQTLFGDGIEKVKNGITSIEELLRVVQAP